MLLKQVAAVAAVINPRPYIDNGGLNDGPVVLDFCSGMIHDHSSRDIASVPAVLEKVTCHSPC